MTRTDPLFREKLISDLPLRHRDLTSGHRVILSFFIKRERASPLVPPSPSPFKLSLSLPFLKGLDGENPPAIISSDRFRYQILLSTAWPREKYPEITPLTSRGAAFPCFVQETRARIRRDSSLSSRSSVTEDTPRGHTFVSPWMALPFVLAKTSFLGFHFELNALTFSLWNARCVSFISPRSSVESRISSLRISRYRRVDRSLYLRSIFFLLCKIANELFPLDRVYEKFDFSR